MDVLVIGGTGLISTAIVQRLLDRKDRVTPEETFELVQ